MRRLLPEPASLILSVIGFCVAVMGGLISLLIAMDSPGEAMSMMGMSIAMFSLFPFILALVIAGLIEPKAMAKGALFGVGAVLCAPLLAAVSFGMGADPEVTFGTALGGGICCASPLFMMTFIPACMQFMKVPKQAREADRREHMEALDALVSAKSEVNLAQYARQHGLTEAQVRTYAEALRDQSRSVRMDPAGRMLFDQVAFSERRVRLSTLIQLKGQVQISEAARELGVSDATVRELVHALVEAGEFDGYADLEGGMLSSAEARSLARNDRCDNCGGRMGLAGKGLLRCDRCGAEHYL